MDAAALFHERRADVAAFSALVFRPSTEVVCSPHSTSSPISSTQPEAQNRRDDCVSLPWTHGVTVTPSYRRPASANIPVSRVLRETKARATRELRMARAARKTLQDKGDSVTGDLPRLATSGDRTGSPLLAMGLSRQEIRDRTYLCMTETGFKPKSATDVSRRAISEGITLTTQQQAKLRRLRIKRTQQRFLSQAQWALWLRRRRRLWYRRRPVARTRHLTRRLALEYGRSVGVCRCCRRKRRRQKALLSARKTPPFPVKAARRMVTQWLPSHSRLVKHFHYRVVSVAVQPAFTHVSLAPRGSSKPARHGGGAPLSPTVPRESRRARRSRLCASPAARIAIPSEPTRKDHRFLQRWVSALAMHQRRQSLCRSTIQAKPSSPLRQSPSAAVSAPSLLADLSHHCVYELTPRGKSSATTSLSISFNAPRGATPVLSSVLSALFEALGLRPDAGDVRTIPSGVVLRLSPTVRHSRTRRSSAMVVHGHMWGAGAASLGDSSLQAADLRHVSVSTLSRHTRVVPVVLVASLRAGASGAPVDIFLFTESPVHFTRRAVAEWEIGLVSLWSPCSLITTYACVFEYWRYNSSVHSSTSETEVLSTVKAALQRCARVYRRLQARPLRFKNKLRVRKGNARPSTSPNEAPGGGKGGAAAMTAAHGGPQQDSSLSRKPSRLLLVLYPSLPSPFLLDSRCNTSEDGASATYAWRLALLYRSAGCRKSAKSTQKSERVEGAAASKEGTVTMPTISSQKKIRLLSGQARRAFFQLARRFCGFLLMAPPPTAVASGIVATRGRCRMLGFQERVTLLHLIGRPAYPIDYGLSRTSAASQQRRRQQSQATPRKARVARRGKKRGRTPTDRPLVTAALTSALLPSSLHLLEYYGNVSNAACRVFVRAEHADRKLSTLHSCVGTILLQCQWRQRPGQSGSQTPCVIRVGVVSSCAFFAQRFGCKIAPVWCCFPSMTRAISGDSSPDLLAHRDDKSLAVSATSWNAVSWTQNTPSEKINYLLAPPEVAEDLLRRSALLQREQPPRKRIRSRRQRAFDLEGGRAVRALCTLLHDPLSCSPVHLIQWYA